MAITLKEFLDENQHRNYPLKDSASARDVTDTMNLPQTLMADMILNVPQDAVISDFYVSNVLIRSLSVDITVSYYNGGSPIEIGVFSEITADGGPHTSYDLATFPQAGVNKKYEAVTGTVVVGLLEDALQYPGSWSFDEITGQLTESVVHTGLAGIRQIVVGDDAFSGTVVLKEGANITIDSEYDAVNDKYILTISSADLGGIGLHSDTDIYNQLLSDFGQPLRTINNITPDNDGNFILSGLDCTELTAITGGLSINNPCSQPCCDKSYLDGVYDALAELNSRYARIIDFYTEVSTNINSIQNKLAMLQLNANIDL